jgi:hypothetical protein
MRETDSRLALAGLTEGAKAALWLPAFSMRCRAEQRHDACGHVDALA